MNKNQAATAAAGEAAASHTTCRDDRKDLSGRKTPNTQLTPQCKGGCWVDNTAVTGTFRWER